MKLRRLILALALLLGGLGFLAQPQEAAAYYGEVEGYVGFSYPGTSNQGVYMEILVMNARRIQVYGYFQNVQTGVYMGFTNYYEYDCWNQNGCYHYIYIPARGYPWVPVGGYHIKKTDYGGQHGIIMHASPQG